ncbi:peptidase family M13 [Colletotrichum godetiae]|uniref:Peptidase family M13 n=1 Tax=Colletotrichum godetiae TaxID=1209918 RepID=A0AAJ0EVM7_9PEZI|nr:peptidase family M13 [Colletotrichum godetiae]KAK1673389.1 peptidase family M13 [Colletotrichum godetiae]
MSEKAPLIPEPEQRVSYGRPTRCPYAQRCSAGKAVVKVFVLATAAGLLYYNIPQTQKPIHEEKTPVCMTPACVHAASEILYNLSPDYKELDPCSDFEELVCGGWRDRHDLRADQGDAFTGTIMSENSELLLRHILEAPYPKDSQHSYFSPLRLESTDKSADEQNFDKMKASYDACVDEDKIKEIGVEPLIQILDEIKNSYPIEAATSVDPSPTKDTILLLSRYGVNAFITSGTGADDRDPDTVVVSVAPPYNLGLPSKERYEDEKLVEKYRGVAVEVLGNLYPDGNKDNFAKVVDLEKLLAAASPPTEELEDVTKTYNPMLIDEASALAPEIELTALIHDLVPEGFVVERVIVMSPKYMTELSTILSGTDNEVIQNYFVWKAIQSLGSYVDADALKPYKHFKNELAGKDPESAPERWRTCVGHVDDGLGWILSRFFVEKAFSAEAKKFGDTIITDIKTEFTKKLKAAKWMDKETTTKAMEKVQNIIQKIGYPTKSPDIMDPPSLNDFYNSVDINPDTFFKNALAVRKFAVGYEWSALGKPVDREQWGMTVPTVNAYYNPPGNEIVFPAGIMQFPVFDVEVPAYMSYGAFGSVAGHELSHAFDSTGRHYDQNGNYTDWWSDATVQAFKDKAECFVEQYSNFSVPGPDDKPLHVNGRLTLGENLADAGGLSASYQAWKRRAHKHPNKDLPGLEHFTQDQLFFVTYSNWWCGMSRKDTAINRIYTDPHAPKWARILGTMSNSREFKESFQCKDKKPTCELW